MTNTVKLWPDKVRQVPLAKLMPDPDQPRRNFEAAGLEVLAANIKRRGVQMPILARPGDKGQIIITDGERRWRAAKLAKLKFVPVLLAPAADDVQRGLDQVAVNNLREGLTPMELARFLVKLRDEQKLTPNEIAARLEKDGLKAMSRSHVSNLMRLVDLPAWAADMLDAGTIEATAARGILAAAESPGAMRVVERTLKDAVNWRGRATVNDVTRAVVVGYTEAAIDLKRTYAYGDGKSEIPHFDWKKVCKGCQHLKEYAGSAFCLNAAEFKRKNDEAKAAGLEVGGAKPKSERLKEATPAQRRKAEQEKVEQRAESLEQKSRDYLHNLLRELAVPKAEALLRALIDWAAAGRPGVRGYEIGRSNERESVLKAAKESKLESLAAFIANPEQLVAFYNAAATAIVRSLPWPETQMVAHHLWGKDLAAFWRVDRNFLALLRKAELAELAETHCVLPEGGKAWSSLKVEDLHEAILAKANDIPPPATLSTLYATIEEREIESWEVDEDEDEPDVEDAEE